MLQMVLLLDDRVELGVLVLLLIGNGLLVWILHLVEVAEMVVH